MVRHHVSHTKHPRIQRIIYRPMRMDVGMLSECATYAVCTTRDPCDMTCQYLYQLSSYLYCSAYDGSTPLTHSHSRVCGHVIPIVQDTKGNLQNTEVNHSVVPCLLTTGMPDLRTWRVYIRNKGKNYKAKHNSEPLLMNVLVY
jgi:hypothetical protein